MSISFNHPKNTMSSTGTLVLSVPSGTPSVPQPIRFDSTSVIMPVRSLPVGEAGSMVFDNSSLTLKYHNGTTWIEIQDTDTILQPIYVDLAQIQQTLLTKVDTVNYSTASVPSASISGTTLSIVFPQTSGGGGTAPSGLFTSTRPGSIMQYSLSSGQSIASIREQMSGVANGQSGRNGTQSNPYISSDGWCLGDGMWWTWNGSGGTITKQVPNLNRGCYLQSLPNVTTATTNTSNVQLATGTIGGTALSIAQLPAHNFVVSGQTSYGGGHVHTFPLSNNRSGTGWADGATVNSFDGTQTTDVAGDHIHTFSGTTNTIGSNQTHTHSLSNLDVDHLTVAYLYNIAEGSVSLTQQLGDARYVLKNGDTMTGPLTIANQANIRGGNTTISLNLLNSVGGERAALIHNSTTNTLSIRSSAGPAMTINNTGSVVLPSTLAVSGATTLTGALTVNANAVVQGKNVVRSVNSTNADTSGNVNITIPKNTALLSGNGWHRDVDTGLITQWGTLSSTVVGNITVTFPIAFPNTCFNVQSTIIRQNNDPGNDPWSYVTSFSNTTASVGSDDYGVYWIAIGY